MTVQLSLIRHGSIIGNSDHRYFGLSANTSLSEKGKNELISHKKQGLFPAADVLFISPYACCKETAPLIYPMLVPIPLDFLSERNFGSFTGKSYDQLKSDPDYQRFLDSKGKISPPGGESETEFSERLRAAVQYIAASVERRNITKASLITHDDCIVNLLFQFSSEAARHQNHIFQLNSENGFTVEMNTHNYSFIMVKPI